MQSRQITVTFIVLLSLSLLKISLATSCSLSSDDGYCTIQLPLPFLSFGEERSTLQASIIIITGSLLIDSMHVDYRFQA